jgi:hypothetical protein
MKTNIEKKELFFLVFGIFLVSLGLIFNQWLVARFFSSEGILEFSNEVFVWFNQVFFLVFGLTLILKRKNAEVCFNVLLLFFTLCLCLLGLELFLRISEKSSIPLNEAGQAVYLSTPEFHHNYRPSQVFITNPSVPNEFEPVENAVNSLAIRGPEIPEKEPGEYRVLLIGDSFVQADEIAFEKTMAELLNKSLGYKKIRVIQHGIGSWSPLLELNWLLKEGFDLKPDLVIDFLCINDFYGSYAMADTSYTKQAEFDASGLPVKFNVSSGSSWWKPRLLDLPRRFFQKNASFTQSQIDSWLSMDRSLVRSSLDVSIPNDVKFSNLIKDIVLLSRPADSWDEETLKTVSLSLGYLEKMNQVVKENNASLALTFVPLGWNVSLNENIEGRKAYGFSSILLPLGGIEEKVREFSLENKIDYINIYDRFKELSSSSEKFFLANDGHFSAKGQEVVSEIISDYLNR